MILEGHPLDRDTAEEKEMAEFYTLVEGTPDKKESNPKVAKKPGEKKSKDGIVSKCASDKFCLIFQILQFNR
jgi:hypothetical protein